MNDVFDGEKSETMKVHLFSVCRAFSFHTELQVME